MSDLTVDLFCEDHAHEEFVGAMTRRLASEAGCTVKIRGLSVRGGHGKALVEFGRYQVLLERNLRPIPDIAVVAIDVNRRKYGDAVGDIMDRVRPVLSGRVVLACPDPYIERWYLVDPESFSRVVGVAPRPVSGKRKRVFYKDLLLEAIRRAGHTPTFAGVEFARDIVHAINLDRASKSDRPLSRFISDLRAAFGPAQAL